MASAKAGASAAAARSKPSSSRGTSVLETVAEFRAALAESWQCFDVILDANPDAVVVLRIADRAIVACNSAFLDYHGLSRDEVIGTTEKLGDVTWLDLRARQRFRDRLDRDGECPPTEVEMLQKDGATGFFLLSAYTVDLHGEKCNVFVSRNITDRKQLELERDELLAELSEALAKVDTLRGIVPICGSCKKIRDDHGFWQQVEVYVHDHSLAEFSHSLCPTCSEEILDDLAKRPRPPGVASDPDEGSSSD